MQLAVTPGLSSARRYNGCQMPDRNFVRGLAPQWGASQHSNRCGLSAIRTLGGRLAKFGRRYDDSDARRNK